MNDNCHVPGAFAKTAPWLEDRALLACPLVDGCPALVRRPIRAAGDGLHPQAARSQRGEPFAVLGDSPPPAGFGWPLFSPRLARRDRAAASSALDSATWCGLASLSLGALEVSLHGFHPLPLYYPTRRSRSLADKKTDSKAALSISAAAQQVQLCGHALHPALTAHVPARSIPIKHQPRTRTALHLTSHCPLSAHHSPTALMPSASQCQYRESSRARRMGWRQGVRPPSPSHGGAQSGRVRVGASRQRALSHPCMCRRVRVVRTVCRSVSDCHGVEYLC